MQVQRIQNNNNYNTNFGIRKPLPKNVMYDEANKFLRKISRENLPYNSDKNVIIENNCIRIKNIEGDELSIPKKIIYNDANEALKKADEKIYAKLLNSVFL